VLPRFSFPLRAQWQLELWTADDESLTDGSDMSKHMMDGLLLWFLHWAKSAGAHGGLRVLSDLDAQDIKNASIDDDLFVNRAAHVLLERLLFRGGTVLIPVYIGRGWSGVVVRDIQKVVPSVAQAVLDDDAQPDAGAFVIFISTHAGNGDTEVDFCFDVVNGLFHSLTAAICQTCLRHMDYVGIGTFFNGCLRTRLPERWVTTPDRELAETADHLLAYFALLLFAERKAADCLFRTDNGLKWIKFHAPGSCEASFAASTKRIDWKARSGMSRSRGKSYLTVANCLRTRSLTVQVVCVTWRTTKKLAETAAHAMPVAMATLLPTDDHTAAANDWDAAEGVLVATGDTWAPTTTPLAMSSPTTDVMAAANDTEAAKSTLLLTGDSFIEATVVTPVATHAVTALALTAMPRRTLSLTTEDTAATIERDAAEDMSLSTGKPCTHATLVTPVGTH